MANNAGLITRRERLSQAREFATHTEAEWLAVKAKYPFCVKCGCKHRDLHKDHVRSIFNGGSDGVDNLQPLCMTCNSSKNYMSIDYRVRIDSGQGFIKMCRCAKCFPQMTMHDKEFKLRMWDARCHLFHMQLIYDRELAKLKDAYGESKDALLMQHRSNEAARLYEEITALMNSK